MEIKTIKVFFLFIIYYLLFSNLKCVNNKYNVGNSGLHTKAVSYILTQNYFNTSPKTDIVTKVSMYALMNRFNEMLDVFPEYKEYYKEQLDIKILLDTTVISGNLKDRKVEWVDFYNEKQISDINEVFISFSPLIKTCIDNEYYILIEMSTLGTKEVYLKLLKYKDEEFEYIKTIDGIILN